MRERGAGAEEAEIKDRKDRKVNTGKLDKGPDQNVL